MLFNLPIAKMQLFNLQFHFANNNTEHVGAVHSCKRPYTYAIIRLRPCMSDYVRACPSMSVYVRNFVVCACVNFSAAMGRKRQRVRSVEKAAVVVEGKYL